MVRIISTIFLLIHTTGIVNAKSFNFNPNATVKVRILGGQKSLTLSGFGIRLNSQNISHASALPTHKIFQIKIAQNRLAIIETPSNVVAAVTDNKVKLRGEMLKINNFNVYDELEIILKRGQIEVVSYLPLEDYIRGVLPNEVPVAWPLEALKAQAVAARSYVLALMNRKSSLPYHVDCTTRHQVFNWDKYLNLRPAHKERVDIATQQTEGLYLIVDSDSPYKTFFHADCGGATEEPFKIWPGAPPNGVVRDRGCFLRKSNNWSHKIAKTELQRALQNYFGLGAEWILQKIVPAEMSTSGRTQALAITFSFNNTNYSELIITQDFREILGFDKIKSTRFSLNLAGDELTVTGQGNGHGAGLCQNGARLMARAGAHFTAILNRYYPRAKLSEKSWLLAKASNLEETAVTVSK